MKSFLYVSITVFQFVRLSGISNCHFFLGFIPNGRMSGLGGVAGIAGGGPNPGTPPGGGGGRGPPIPGGGGGGGGPPMPGGGSGGGSGPPKPDIGGGGGPPDIGGGGGGGGGGVGPPPIAGRGGGGGAPEYMANVGGAGFGMGPLPPAIYASSSTIRWLAWANLASYSCFAVRASSSFLFISSPLGSPSCLARSNNVN